MRIIHFCISLFIQAGISEYNYEDVRLVISGHFKKRFFFTNCDEKLDIVNFNNGYLCSLAHHGCNAGILVKSFGG